MIIVSYDIADDKVRARFSRMLCKQGAIRLQYSVYEVNNTPRILNNILLKIEDYSKHFTFSDSVVVFDVDSDKILKYGNAIHRDTDIIYL